MKLLHLMHLMPLMHTVHLIHLMYLMHLMHLLHLMLMHLMHLIHIMHLMNLIHFMQLMHSMHLMLCILLHEGSSFENPGFGILNEPVSWFKMVNKINGPLKKLVAIFRSLALQVIAALYSVQGVEVMMTSNNLLGRRVQNSTP